MRDRFFLVYSIKRVGSFQQPHPLWNQRPVARKTIFLQTKDQVGGQFWNDSNALHLSCTLFLLLLYNSTSDHQALDIEGWGPLLQSRRREDISSFWRICAKQMPLGPQKLYQMFLKNIHFYQLPKVFPGRVSSDILLSIVIRMKSHHKLFLTSLIPSLILSTQLANTSYLLPHCISLPAASFPATWVSS